MSQITNYRGSITPSPTPVITINSQPPDLAGNFLLTGGTDISITNGPAANEITISFTGGGVAGDYVTDSGTANPAAGILNVLGDRDINTSGSGNTVHVNLNNSITLGDLSSIIGSDAITLVTGDLTLSAGNIDLSSPNVAGTTGVITVVGERFLHYGRSGSGNIFLGALSGNFTNTGTANIGIGQSALGSITTMSESVAIGHGSMDQVTTGARNAVIGYLSFNQIVPDSQDNTSLGWKTGFNQLSGTANTYVGSQAGVGINTGSYNTLIGYQAGANYTAASGSNVVLGNAGTVGDSHTIRIGTQGAGNYQQNKAFMAGIVGVTTSNSQMVTVNSATGQLGAATIPTSASTVPYTGINAASSPYTVLAADYYIGANATAGAITVLMPNAPSTGRVIIVKDMAGIASTNNITVTTVGGAVTIDGSTSFVLNTNYQAAQFIFNGSSYEVF